MDDIDLRAASTADVPELLALVREYWRFENIEGFEPGRVGALLQELIGNPVRGRLWLARVAGQPAGYLLGVFVFSLEFRGLTGEIDEFFVAATHRGLGLGTRLLATAEEEFRAAGCGYVALRLGRENEAARAFYRRHGYRDRDGFEIIDKTLQAAMLGGPS